MPRSVSRGNTWYNFKASTDLTNWSVLQTKYFPSNGVFDLTDVESSNYPSRFYRRADAPVPPPSFGKRLGANGQDSGRAVALDSQDNIYVMGNFSGFLNLGGGNMVASGTSDIFLAKYDSAGTFLWQKKLGSTGFESPRAIAIDPSGDLVIAGFFSGTTDLRESIFNTNSCKMGAIPYGNNLVASGGADIFLATYDSSGVCSWARRFGAPATDTATSVAVDLQGNILLGGSFQQAVDFGNGTALPAALGNNAGYLAKYDYRGAYLWAQTFDTSSQNYIQSVCGDSSDNAILALNFNSSTSSTTNTLLRITSTSTNTFPLAELPTNSTSFCLAKVTPGASNAPGNIVWLRCASVPTNTTASVYVQAKSVSVDAVGSIYVSGVFIGPLVLGGNDGSFADASGTTNVLTNTGDYWVPFIAKYSASGACLWVKVLPGSSNGAAFVLASCVDPNQFLSIAGTFSDTLTVDGNTLTNFNPLIDDIFVSKFSPTGVHQWTKHYGGEYTDTPNAMAPNSASGLVVAGSFQGTNVVLGPLTTNSANNSVDGFVFQIDP